MNQINSLLTLPISSELAVDLISRVFKEDDLRVMRSFDLQSACSAFSDNICPSHGEETCDCQLVVLLVYDKKDLPVSIVLHGHKGRTQLGIADDLGQAAPPRLLKRIETLLSPSKIRASLKVLVPNALK